MSEAAKKHPIEVILRTAGEEHRFKIPKKDKAKVLNFLEKYDEELVPWREAFKEEIEKYTEAGYSLRVFRLDLGLTQTELGKKLGIEQNSISQMEHGKRPIGKVMAKRFAKFFKTDYRIFL